MTPWQPPRQSAASFGAKSFQVTNPGTINELPCTTASTPTFLPDTSSRAFRIHAANACAVVVVSTLTSTLGKLLG